MLLVHDDNAGILRGERHVMRARKELVSNLTRNVGGTSWAEGKRSGHLVRHWGWGFWASVSGLVFISGGILLLGNILCDAITFLENFPGVVLVEVLGIGLAFGWGYFYLRKAFITALHSDYVAYVFDELIAKGEIAEGEVLSIDTITSTHRQIEYRFTLPESGAAVIGIYRTSTHNMLEPGCKVAVLFLNRYVHVLL